MSQLDVTRTPSTSAAMENPPNQRRASTGGIGLAGGWRSAAAAVISERRGSAVSAAEMEKVLADQAAAAQKERKVSISDVATTLLAPNYDDPLKKHSYAASFGNTARELSEEPGFEKAGQLCPVHVYTDREKTSFLTETRGGAFSQARRPSLIGGPGGVGAGWKAAAAALRDAAEGGERSGVGSIADVATTLLGPSYDKPLKKHSYAASFGNTARELSEEPGFEKAGQLCPVHVYTDREKTSFLTETRGAAAFHHAPNAPSAKRAEAELRESGQWKPTLTKPVAVNPRLLQPLQGAGTMGGRGRTVLGPLHGTPFRPTRDNVHRTPMGNKPSPPRRTPAEWRQIWHLAAPDSPESPVFEPPTRGLRHSLSVPGSATRSKLPPVLPLGRSEPATRLPSRYASPRMLRPGPRASPA